MKRSRAPPAVLDERDSSDSEDDFFAGPEEEEEEEGGAAAPDSRQMYASGGKLGAKRRSKHVPAEVSSKKRPPLIQNVVHVPKVVRRDPRFEETSGMFNQHLFKTTYTFLDHATVKGSAGEHAVEEWMKAEREKRLHGKKAFHLSARGKKDLVLQERFKELEAKGPAAVEKFMLKKRKKAATKDRKALPWHEKQARS